MIRAAAVTATRRICSNTRRDSSPLVGSWSYCPTCCNNERDTVESATVTRLFSSSSDNSSTVAFDRNLKRLQRDGAARRHQAIWDGETSTTPTAAEEDRVKYDYFREEIARRLVDRLDDIKIEGGFPLTLDIGTYIHTRCRLVSNLSSSYQYRFSKINDTATNRIRTGLYS